MSATLALASRGWRNLQIYASQALAIVIRGLAYILSFLPSLPEWLGGSKDLNIAGAMNEFAAGLDQAAATMAEKLNADIANGTLAKSALEGGRNMAASLRERANSSQAALDASLATETAADRLKSKIAEAREKQRADAAAAAAAKMRGTKTFTAALDAASDDDSKSDKKKDQASYAIGAAGRNSREAFESIAKARNASDPTADNTKRAADAAQQQIPILQRIEKSLGRAVTTETLELGLA